MDIKPSLGEFKHYAQRKNLVVFSHKFYCDFLTPPSVYHRVCAGTKRESFLLESVAGEEKISRFSFIGFDPLVTFQSKDDTITLRMGAKVCYSKMQADPLRELQKTMKQFRLWPKEHIRFFGGFVGYVGYDVVHFYEPVGKRKKNDLATADTYFILPKYLFIFDHLTKQVELLSFCYLSERSDDLQKVYKKEVAGLRRVFNKIIAPTGLPLLCLSDKNDTRGRAGKISLNGARSTMSKEEFVTAVKKAKRYIKEGDIIQVVLSQRFQASFSGDPFLVYRYLRVLNPSPYMYYLNFNDTRIVGSSPEMLLRCEEKNLITRPIAGTRRRGRNDNEDAVLARQLLADPKERAEHVMLVDLGRNDVGRVADKGTVNVPVFMKIEHFSHVMHIVSEVTGRLVPGKDMFDALSACFPAGTLSGAPKVRAMQIINELEPCTRGIYGGCIGYFSFTKSLDTCIIIRTILFKNRKAYIQAGAGIVADSKPLTEYEETINKARAQLAAISLAAKPHKERV